MLVFKIVFLLVVNLTLSELSNDLRFVSREEWGARPPRSVEYMTTIPIYTFIHHSYIPAACYNMTDCIKAMQQIQNFHMDDKKWDDIGYSFAIGSDGRVYVGRGWDRVGAHTKGYNSVGLGFLVIGDYRFHAPNQLALDTIQKLINYGVKTGKIVNDYILRGHRDMDKTECPGDALYFIIRKWTHY